MFTIELVQLNVPVSHAGAHKYDCFQSKKTYVSAYTHPRVLNLNYSYSANHKSTLHSTIQFSFSLIIQPRTPVYPTEIVLTRALHNALNHSAHLIADSARTQKSALLAC